MYKLALAIVAAGFFATPAWADGALAMGYAADGSVVWGYEFGHKSVEEAKPKALQYCQSRGSDCTLVRDELYGDGAWVAIALDQTGQAPQRVPFGEHYSSSKDKAAKMAIAACEKNGGRHCKVVFLKQNTKPITYRSVPGGGNGSMVWDSARGVWIVNGTITGVPQSCANVSIFNGECLSR